MEDYRFINEKTGDILEVPPPDELGASVILLNGRVVENVLYSDEDGGSRTLGNGATFHNSKDFANYIVEKLRTDGWKRGSE